MTRKITVNSGLFLDIVSNRNTLAGICVFILSVPQVHLGTRLKTPSDTAQIKFCYFTVIACHGEKNPTPTRHPPSNLKLYLSKDCIFKDWFGKPLSKSLKTFWWREQEINQKKMCKEKKSRFSFHSEVIGTNANTGSWDRRLQVNEGLETKLETTDY